MPAAYSENFLFEMAWMMNQFPGMFSEDSLAIMGLERAMMSEDTRANLDT